MNITDAAARLDNIFTEFCLHRAVDLSGSWLIAVSGGCDSTALASVAARVVTNRGGAVALAHLDHGIRPPDEGELEYLHVRRFADSLRCRLYRAAVAQGTLVERANAAGSGVEEVARDARYRFLSDIARESGATCVATGHHAGDQAETVMMRLLGGSGVIGLAGIPAQRTIGSDADRKVELVRPFLSVDPELIRTYNRSMGLSWIEDSSNKSMDHLRNRLRYRVMPVLREIDAGVHDRIAVVARKMAENHEALRYAAAEFLPPVRDGAVEVSAPRFFALPTALRLEVLFLAAERVSGRPGCEALPSRFFAPLLDGRTSPATVSMNRPVVLRGHGLLVTSDDRSVRVACDIVRCEKKGYLVHSVEPASFTMPDDFSMMIEVCVSLHGKTAVTRIQSSGFRPPVIVRSPRPGDSVVAGYGRKLLKKLMNEAGVADHTIVPVVEDRQGIAAVLLSPWGRRDALRVGVDTVDTVENRDYHAEHPVRLWWKGDSGFEELIKQQSG